MRFLLACCLIFLCAVGSNAQSNIGVEPEHPVVAKIKELKKRNVDTIVEYYCNCGPNYVTKPPDTCRAKDAEYLIWKENNDYFIQKFDWCNTYKSQIVSSVILNLIGNNYSTIEKEELKLFSYSETKGGIVLTTEILRPSHSGYQVLEIHTADKVLRKEINEGDLIKQGNGHINENYDYNNSLLIIRLQLLAENQINNYNAK